MPNSQWTTSDGSTAIPTTYEVSEVASAFSPPSGTQTVGKKGMVPSPSSVATANNYFLRADGTWAPIPGGGATNSVIETKRPSVYSRSGNTQGFADSTDYQLAYDLDVSHTGTFGNWDALPGPYLIDRVTTLLFDGFSNSTNLPYDTGSFTVNICRGYESILDGAGGVSSVQWDYSFNGTDWINIATDYTNQPLSPTISTLVVSNTSPTLSNLRIRAVMTRGAGDSIPLPSQPDEPPQNVTEPSGQIYLNIFDIWTQGVYQVANPSGSGVTSFNTRTGAITLTSSDVTGALTFTPYNSTNPSGYISSITSTMVTNALGYTPYNSSNPSAYISGITPSMIANAGGVITAGSYTNPPWIVSLDGAKITGNITAYNLSGGLVDATTGTFSGTVTIKSGLPLGKMTLVPVGSPNPINPAEGDIAWIY